MTETVEAGGSVPTSARLRRFLATPRGRFFGGVACVVLILGVAIGIYFLGRASGTRDLNVANGRIIQIQGEFQKATTEMTKQTATIVDLQTKLKNAQDKLEAIMPAANRYHLSPNEAAIVADGHLTIGLIGSPTNESVNININGKQQSAAAGNAFDIAPDPSTTCQVKVQSFDMFKAFITASCTAAKPQ